MTLPACFRHPWLLPVYAGIFIGTSYIPFPPWAALFGFVPLWLFWRQQTGWLGVLLGGLLSAFVFTLIGFNWVALTLHQFAHLDWPWAVLGLMVYALVANLYVPVAGLLWFAGQRWWGRTGARSLLALALVTTLCEANSYTLFDWNFGYSWYGAGLPIYQWAECIGFSGLSALTVMTNLPLLLAWQNRRNEGGWLPALPVLIGFVLLNCGGLWLKSRLPAPDATVNALLVQGSINSEDKLAAELGKNLREVIWQRYQTLTAEAIAAHKDTKIDLVMWPETAFPYLLGDWFRQSPQSQALTAFVRQQQVPLLTGAYSVETGTKRITNSLFVFDENGHEQPPHYSKTILLAFGEFIPGEDYFPVIREWLPATGHFARGAGPSELLKLHGFKMGAQICYESLFPRFSRSLAQLGAQFIVNVTNDSWYGDWQEPYQHLYMTLGRGVEFRRPVLRVTNSGISTVGLASGEVLELSPIDKPWAGLYKIPYRQQPQATFYQTYFWLLPGLLWAALAAVLWWPGRRGG
ncbi:apolipoprotein N-acyltransferase [Methylovulum psychrotolerans]|uniref:apolipoprotein N-acyltransferase n=1 Tax=Methylovulum psychrotolerans TaxID=1704499 RepID=UPI001BFFC220|nr:apolipoprotein N-acyltransferase [Methylovulum psychrotolerans]MBT9100118.1 apolipoprotein N-acyltransferase [Methylovulum psychrotolerans]